jgi:hypothetical protein
MLDYDTKEKEHQNTRQSDLHSGATPPRANLIASCFDAPSITCYIFALSCFCHGADQIAVSYEGLVLI